MNLKEDSNKILFVHVTADSSSVVSIKALKVSSYLKRLLVHWMKI